MCILLCCEFVSLISDEYNISTLIFLMCILLCWESGKLGSNEYNVSLSFMYIVCVYIYIMCQPHHQLQHNGAYYSYAFNTVVGIVLCVLTQGLFLRKMNESVVTVISLMKVMTRKKC